MAAQRIRDIFIRLVFYWRRQKNGLAGKREKRRTERGAKAREERPKRGKVGKRTSLSLSLSLSLFLSLFLSFISAPSRLQ